MPPPPTERALRIRILGVLELLDPEGVPVPLPGRQARALLALLITSMPEAISVERLVEELWPQNPPATARHALQVYASRIRDCLRRAELDVNALRSGGGAYELDLDRRWLDATRFEVLVNGAESAAAADPAVARSQLSRALSLWRGPALAGLEDVPRLRAEAGRLEDGRMAAVERLAEVQISLNNPQEAVAQLGPLIVAAPLRERPRALMMRALYRAGRHAEALEQYRELREAMRELGLNPSRELRDLQAAILRHDDGGLLDAREAPPSPHTDLPPERPRPASKNRVPRAGHPLVGRRAEIEAIEGILFERGVRLLTVQGPGGSGKTRLALELAVRFADRLEHGSSFVQLAPLNDHRLVVPAIARQLEVEAIPGRDVEETLWERLADRELLLVIDNFEHVIEARGAISRLLEAAPRLKLLVTSRAALRVRGENRFDLAPLPPEDAAELFLARAREIRPEIGAAPGDGAAIRRIVRELDGLPLALELVAARVAVFSLPALAGRLGDRLDVSAAHDAPARQRTLRDTIDWSYRLLSGDEQRLLRSMTAFLGGARLEALEAVCGDPPIDVVEVVSGLVGKSLLRRRDDPDGAPRMAMLVTIWEFAHEMLTRSGELKDARDRHAAHFLRFVLEAGAELYGPDLTVWLERLELEEENCRLALDHLLEHAPEDAARMTAALGLFWDIRGTRFGASERLAAALPKARGAREKGQLSFWLGRFRFRANELESANELFAAAAELAEETGDIRTAVYSRAYLALASPLPDGSLNLPLYEALLTAARAAGDDWALIDALGAYGDALQMAGLTEAARPLLEEALRLARRIGNPLAINVTNSILGELAARAGEVEQAERLMSDALASAREIGLRWLVVSNLGDLAVQALRRGERRLAGERVREAAREYKPGDTVVTMGMLAAAAVLAAMRGSHADALMLWACFEQAVPRGFTPGGGVQELRDRWRPESLEMVGEVAAGHAVQAASLLSMREAVDLAAAQAG